MSWSTRNGWLGRMVSVVDGELAAVVLLVLVLVAGPGCGPQGTPLGQLGRTPKAATNSTNAMNAMNALRDRR